MPVVEDDGKGGKRRTNRARRERKGTPQGAPISPPLSNLSIRRFILGWKVLGFARRFRSEIVNYADDFCVLGKALAAEMLTSVRQLIERLKLTINDDCPAAPDARVLAFRSFHLDRIRATISHDQSCPGPRQLARRFENPEPSQRRHGISVGIEPHRSAAERDLISGGRADRDIIFGYARRQFDKPEWTIMIHSLEHAQIGDDHVDRILSR